MNERRLKLQAQTDFCHCLYLILHVDFSLPWVTRSHHDSVHCLLSFSSRVFTFSLTRASLLIGWLRAVLRWICGDVCRDSVVYDCVCVFFIHACGQRRGIDVFCYTFPPLGLFLHLSTWLMHCSSPLSKACVYFAVDLPNALAKDIPGRYLLICWHHHCYLLSKAVSLREPCVGRSPFCCIFCF